MKQSIKSVLERHSTLLLALESFFTTWALMKAARMESGNILTGAFFLLSFFLYRHIHSRLDTCPFLQAARSRRICLFLSLLFTFFYMIVDYDYYIQALTSRLFQFLVLAAVFLGFTILFYRLLLLLYSYFGDADLLRDRLFLTEKNGSSPKGLPGFIRRHLGLCSFLICLLCWLPYFLYQYPGIMTPDSINQFEQVLGLIPYSNHHPVAHTLLIGLFYQIGLLFTDDMVVAISFYTFFQMCAMAFSVSYLIQTLKLLRFRPAILLAVTLFYALVPYHAVFAVTIWKDILFAAAVLLFGCCLLRLTLKVNVRTMLLFFLSGFLICLFRSNGWYGFLLCFPFLLFFLWRSFSGQKRAALCLLVTGILLSAALIRYPVMKACGVIQPDLVESLSIPIQQIANVICKDRPLTEEERDLIEEVVDLTYIKELYNPTYADNMKELVRAGNPSFLSDHKSDYLKLWLTLLRKYPGDYLEAYVNQTYGYFYPDSFYLVAEAEGVSATELGVSHTPLIGGPLVVKAKEIAIKLGSMVPIYSLLWSMGVAFWFFLFCTGNVLIRPRGKKAKLICFLPSFALYLTVMIATPVATEFRYVYFLVFSLPFYFLVSLADLEKH